MGADIVGNDNNLLVGFVDAMMMEGNHTDTNGDGSRYHAGGRMPMMVITVMVVGLFVVVVGGGEYADGNRDGRDSC